MSQPDPASASVRRARPAGVPTPLRVVSERVWPDEVPSGGPAQMRAGFTSASSMPAPLAVVPCPQPWPDPTWPPHGVDAPSGDSSRAAAAPDQPQRAAPAGSASGPIRLAVVPAAAASRAPGSADLVPARSLLPVPAHRPPRRPLLQRLVDVVVGRRDPAGRHRPDSISSATWSMCAQPRRRSWWRAR